MLLPANRQNNERTKTPRKRVSLLPVLPLKQCHRNSLPSSFIVQTRLLFFFSFQILRQTLLLLKAAKESPFARYGKSGEFCVLRSFAKENKRKKKFVIFDCETTTTTTTTSCHRRRRRQRRRRHEHHHQQKRRNAKRDRRRLLLLKRRRRKQREKKKKKKMVTVQLLRRRRNERL